MADGEGKRNGDSMKFTKNVPCLKSETNGFKFLNCDDIAKGGSVASEGIQTYKRRRRTRSCWGLEEWGADVESSSQLADQILKEQVGRVEQNNSCEQAHLRVNSSDACSERHWRNSILENMYQSLGDDEGGVQVCIRQALEHFRESGHTTRIKESGYQGEDRHQCCLPKQSLLSGPHNAANGHAGVTSNGSSNKSDHHTVTTMCHHQHALFNVLVSEKFATLCKLLLENFEGIKADRIFDLSLINSRMKKGAYEHSPLLFSVDMQQVWRKLQRIGSDLVSLAKSLSDMSSSSYNEQVGGSLRDTFEGEKNEVGMLESDSHTKMEQAEHCGVHSVCTCRNCGCKADERDCLVCDSCEEMYHVSCIEPAVKGIPVKSWYCASCTANGVRSSHENCVVCEKLNMSKPPVEGESVSIDEETVDEMCGNSNCSTDNGMPLSEESRDFIICKVCGNEVENGDKLRECGHQYCPKKYYHERCLTTKQLKSYGPIWYCYSCLCRRCLADEEDDMIVLCDGCDHGYHIYCMEPPLTSIPTGKWFCRKCDAALKVIRRAKISYDTNNQKQTKKSGGSRKLNGKADNRKLEQGRGGMEALLCAVKTLNNEED